VAQIADRLIKQEAGSNRACPLRIFGSSWSPPQLHALASAFLVEYSIPTWALLIF
jgi:hypothetical protein